MAFIAGNNSIGDLGVTVSRYSTAARPTGVPNGTIIYNTTTYMLEVYDSVGATWTPVNKTANYLYKQIITKSYVMGGYQSLSPWRNVNRMVHATDVMTNLGDLLANAGAYTSGVNNLTRGFIWSMDNTWPGTSTSTSAFNIATETTAGTNTNWNTRISRDDMGTGFQEHLFAYITGGGSTAIDVFNLTTEVMSNNIGAASNTTGNTAELGGTGSVSDLTACYFWGAGSTKLVFSTGTALSYGAYGIAGLTNLGGAHGQQKGINSKLGRGYAGNEGSYAGGYNLRRMVFATDTYTTIAKPIGNSGEENLDMGQTKQYLMGMYDGAQNNRGWRFTYSTDTGIELGAGSVRTGVPGGSSGHCVWGS